MTLTPPKIPKKYHPRGIQFLHEDLDLILVRKESGILTVAARWEQQNTVEGLINNYLRKGSTHSKKQIYVVHRLDQATSGVLIFAKSEAIQQKLKEDWKNTKKTYLTIVEGHLTHKSGVIRSQLEEDEDYVVRSADTASSKTKLAETEYEVLAETPRYSLLKINLLTGRKNQIRVHMAEAGHPIVGDSKYAATVKGEKPGAGPKSLALHAARLEFTHPFKQVRVTASARVPEIFHRLVPFDYSQIL